MHQAEQQPMAHRAALRAAGACTVVGSLLVAGFRMAHGDLPAADAPAALRFITEHPFYAGVHIGAVLGVVVWAGGFIAFASTLTTGRTRLLGRLGAAGILAGTAVYTIEHSIDGVAGQGLAQAWAAAKPAGQADLELAAQTAFTMLRGPSLTGIILLWGLPLILFGRAVMLERYPAWLGWTGLAVGAATVLGATVLLFDRDAFPGVLLYGLLVSIVVQLWSAVLGIRMWGRAGAAPASPQLDDVAASQSTTMSSQLLPPS